MHISTENLELGGEEPSSERVLIVREDLSNLLLALEDMPPRRREILLLNRLDGLSYSQLAVRYGVTVSAIEKQMMKAIAHIHTRMGSHSDRTKS
ncbi:hypothetical protein ABAC402_14990 [Asticcacaulis sp. AC402]|nr:hypothetical protein ABAC402_14990 [Asticcacaulis sp. AC402]